MRTYLYFEGGTEADRVPLEGNDQYRFQGIKLRIDGSPYAGGMAMYDPYSATPTLTTNGLGIPSGSTGEYAPI